MWFSSISTKVCNLPPNLFLALWFWKMYAVFVLHQGFLYTFCNWSITVLNPSNRLPWAWIVKFSSLFLLKYAIFWVFNETYVQGIEDFHRKAQIRNHYQILFTYTLEQENKWMSISQFPKNKRSVFRNKR